MRSVLLSALLCFGLTGCSTMDAVLDYPMSFFEEDEETGEMVEVTTTVGDALASNADGISGVIGNAVGGVNPLLGLLAAGGAGALLQGRRKKKAALQADEAEPAKGKSKKA